jgi:hypothetical protein
VPSRHGVAWFVVVELGREVPRDRAPNRTAVGLGKNLPSRGRLGPCSPLSLFSM